MSKRDLRSRRVLGVHTKCYIYKDGRCVGGKPFSRGHLYALLSNPTYIGEVRHRGERYPGKHKAIVKPAVWLDVQDLLAMNAVSRSRKENANETNLLTGLLFDETGDRLSPSHATKKGKRYRYYISHRLMQAHAEGQDGWRLPARELETKVVRTVTDVLEDPQRIVDLLADDNPDSHLIRAIRGRSRELASRLASNHPAEKSDCLRQIIVRIDVNPGRLRSELNQENLEHLLNFGDADGNRSDVQTPLVIDVPFAIKRRGVEARIILGNNQSASPCHDDNLIKAVAKAHDWFEQLTSGKANSVQEIASSEGLNRADVSLALPLAFLTPDIVDTIIAGRQPVDLTWEKFGQALPLPSCWHKQRRLLGFCSANWAPHRNN